MTVEEAVYNLLRSDSSVTALCPASRIKVPGAWQNLSLPYIVHKPVAIEPTQIHGEGRAALNIWSYYEVAVFAGTYSAGRTIVDAVINCLDGPHPGIDIQLQGGSFYIGGQPDFEAEHFAVNFRIAEALTSSPS